VAQPAELFLKIWEDCRVAHRCCLCDETWKRTNQPSTVLGKDILNLPVTKLMNANRFRQEPGKQQILETTRALSTRPLNPSSLAGSRFGFSCRSH